MTGVGTCELSSYYGSLAVLVFSRLELVLVSCLLITAFLVFSRLELVLVSCLLITAVLVFSRLELVLVSCLLIMAVWLFLCLVDWSWYL